MEILVTNDDGINSPAINKLAEVLKQYGNVTVVAPDRDQSGKGPSVTLRDVLRYNQVDINVDKVDAYAVEGTPSDCVILANKEINPKGFDYIFSGINYGANMGSDLLISGTAGAAIHGYLSGTLSVALSIASLDAVRTDITSSIEYSSKICEFLIKNNIKEPQLLNVNFPNLPSAQIKGTKTTYIGPKVGDEILLKESRARGDYYWLRLDLKENVEFPKDTDMKAIQDGYVSVSVVDINLNPGGTDHNKYSEMRYLVNQLTEYLNE